MTTEIQEYSATDAALAVLREKYGNVVYDCSTRDGLAFAKAARAEVRDYRVALEKKRVEIKAPALDRCRLIDTEAKRITAALVALEDPADQQIKDHEAKVERERLAKEVAEAARVRRHQDVLAWIRGCADAGAAALPTQGILGLMSRLEQVPTDNLEEFSQQGAEAKVSALAALRKYHEAAVQREADAAELAALRAAQAKQREADERKAAQERAEAAEREAATLAKARAAEAQQRAAQAAAQAKLDEQRKAQAAEEKRLANERRRLDQERQAAEQDKRAREVRELEAEEERRRRAARAARKRPTDKELVEVLAEHYDAEPELVNTWLKTWKGK